MTAIMSNIRSCTMRHTHTRLIGKSPFNAKAQVAHQLDWQWQFKFIYAPMKGVQLAALRAELAAADLGGNFAIYHPDYPRGLAYNGAGLVNGAGQVGTSLATDSWPASTIVGYAGEPVIINFGSQERMFLLTATATTNGAGQVTLQLDSPMPGSPPDNNSASFNPAASGHSIIARLTNWSETDSDAAGWAQITMTGEEVI